MIGSVPPVRVRSGRVPSARSKASRPSRIAGASGRTRPGGAPAQRTSTSAPAAAASRTSRSAAAPIVSTSWPGASRIVNSPDAATESVVLRTPGLPPTMPFTSADGSAHVRR